MVVIVGAGLAGLVCARVLREAGQQVTILERDVVPGGRLRTEQHPEGFLLDRGFQVLFTAYPAARRHLSLGRLALQPFVPGALVARDGKLHEVADPLRAPGYLFTSAASPLFSLGDKLRILQLQRSVRKARIAGIFASGDSSTEAYLQSLGFSPRFIDNFARPFYGGLFLDRSLATSSTMFRFTFKMLSDGEAAVPAKGIQEIAEQLAHGLPARTVHYGVAAERLLIEGGRVRGVQTTDGQQIEAPAVVVATDPHTAASLTGAEDIPHTPVPCISVYFSSPTSLYGGRLIVLNANPDAYVNSLVQISNVAPSYAPEGQHLLSLTIPGSSEEPDETIARRCREELAALFPAKAAAGLRLLRIFRIPFARFAQPPGIYRSLPTNASVVPGLYLASEATFASSIEGAMRSGEGAARQILQGARPPVAGEPVGSAS